tara:strand:+ start:437 stop:1018 length:582 start_codon:yes stop_codon:yes gene_type:complete
MRFNKTWNDVKNDNSIELMEHPIFNSSISKIDFYEEFSQVLDLLDGETMTDFVDFFFQRDPINNSNFKFIGENEKMDFYEWAVDEGCLPGLKEIHQGESVEDKRKRSEKEEIERLKKESIKTQKEKEREKRENISEKDKLFKILDNKWKGLEKLRNKKVVNLDKINKALNGFNKDYEYFKEQYGAIDIFEKNV